MHKWCTCSPNRGRYGRASELKLLVVTASTTLNCATPSHRFRTHNSVVVGSSPTRPTGIRECFCLQTIDQYAKAQFAVKTSSSSSYTFCSFARRKILLSSRSPFLFHPSPQTLTASISFRRVRICFLRVRISF